jgi:hypothetical protein
MASSVTNHRVVAAVLAVVVIAAITVVVVTVTSSSRCEGLRFPTKPESKVTTPPIGGQARLLDRARRAFGLSHTSVSYCHDFADPFVLRVGDQYFAYATNSGRRHIPVLYGAGLFNAQHERDALPHLPKWAKPGKTWAPSVIAIHDAYVLYYTTTERESDKQCISTALAAAPTGPFTDSSAAPLLCDAIDPRPILDPHGTSLLWAAAGEIHAARLAADLRTLEGPSVTLLQADQPWEHGIVEAPTMRYIGKRYFLFYSGNDWASAAYAINYARCDGPLGPCTKASGPWIAAQGGIAGPGGQDFFDDTNKDLWMVFHGWGSTAVGYPAGARYLFVIPIQVTHGVPTVGHGNA